VQFYDDHLPDEADKDILNRIELNNNISPSLQSAKEIILYYKLG